MRKVGARPWGFKPTMTNAWLGMGEFLDAMRRHHVAGMEARVDQRHGAGEHFDSRVERDAQLAEEPQVRPKAGRDDDVVTGEKIERLPLERHFSGKAVIPVRRCPRQRRASACSSRPSCIARAGRRGRARRAPATDRSARRRAAFDAVAAQRREDFGGRRLVLRLPSAQRRVDRRIATADDQHALPTYFSRSVPATSGMPEAMRSAASRSPGTGRPSMPAGFSRDHVPDASMTALASTRCSPRRPRSGRRRRACATFVRDLVVTLAGDGGDGRSELQIGGDLRKRSERCEIIPHDLSACRQMIGLRAPSIPSDRAGRAPPHRCCSARARRRAHGPIRGALRRRSGPARRRAGGCRAGQDALPRRGRRDGADDYDREALGIMLICSILLASSN